jgi:hypothetical protein
MSADIHRQKRRVTTPLTPLMVMIMAVVFLKREIVEKAREQANKGIAEVMEGHAEYLASQKPSSLVSQFFTSLRSYGQTSPLEITCHPARFYLPIARNRQIQFLLFSALAQGGDRTHPGRASGRNIASQERNYHQDERYDQKHSRIAGANTVEQARHQGRGR